MCGIDFNSGHIAEQYKEAKQHPWRTLIESYSLHKLVGDVNDLRVVDLACGEGFYARKLVAAGAALVVGVDISHRMIELARHEEDIRMRECRNVGIEPGCRRLQYKCADVRSEVEASVGGFDVAIAAWLLVNCSTRQELDEVCRGAASWLKPGGRFIVIISNPENASALIDFSKYGFEMIRPSSDPIIKEGDMLQIRFDTSFGPLVIDNFFFSLPVYVEALVSAGFCDITIQDAELNPQCPEGSDDFYSDFIRWSPLKFFVCSKVGNQVEN